MTNLSTSLYGDGEELIGKWFKRTGKRDDIFLATKFGFIRGSQTFEVDSSAEYTKKACSASLAKLGIDSIDLCKKNLVPLSLFFLGFYYQLTVILDYLHSPNLKTPIEETMRALAELQK